MTTEDDSADLQKLAGGLPPVDVDPARAVEIVQAARRDVGHGPPRRRIVEAVLVAILVSATFAWALFKVYEALG
ncbi:MAG: hypothetical protein ABI678_06170 [Kofleriaceae bacterium]